MEIKKISPEEYAAFGKQFENWNFLNSTEMGTHFQNEPGWIVQYYGGFENGKLEAASMAVLRPLARIRKYARIPRGFLTDYSNLERVKSFTREFRKTLRSEGIMFAEMDPYIGLRQRDQDGHLIEGGWNHMDIVQNLQDAGFEYQPPVPGSQPGEPAFVSELDIQGKSMDQLMKEMDQQTRWSINRSRKMNLTLEPASTKEQLADFCKMMEHTGKRNGFDSPNAAYYESFLISHPGKAELILAYLEPVKLAASQDVLYQEAAKEMEQVEAKLKELPSSKKMIKRRKVLQEAMDLALSKKEEASKLKDEYGDKILLAGSLFVWNEREMVYLFSGAYDQFFKMHAPYAIHDRMIQKAIEMNLKVYNFYGIAGRFEKEEEGYSLFDFKRGFGCVPKELLGTFRLPVNDLEYSLYKKWKKM